MLGHEILGIVESVPADVPVRDLAGRPLQPGDRVTWSVAAACGTCFYCSRGLPQKCERLFKYGHQRLARERPFSGGLADYCRLVRGTAIVPVPRSVPDFVACPASCATATVVGALASGGPCRGETVLVQGLGMLGLTACAVAQVNGAEEIIATDTDSTRRGRALDFGATHAAPPGETLKETVLAATDGRGVDLALEFSGSSEAIEMGLPLLRIGGRYTLVGSVLPTPSVAVNPEMVVRRMLTISGVHNYAPQHLADAVDFLARHHRDYPLASLVDGPYSLESANEAFRHASQARSLRVAVVP